MFHRCGKGFESEEYEKSRDGDFLSETCIWDLEPSLTLQVPENGIIHVILTMRVDVELCDNVSPRFNAV